MPHNAAVIALRYAGTDLQESDFSVFLEIESGLHDGLTVRGRDTVVPALAGRIARNRVKDRRVIQLAGWVSGVGSSASAQADAFRDVCQEMEALFDQTTTATLEADLEDGTTVQIEARTIEIHFAQQRTPVLQRLEVDLESVAPDWTLSGS